MSNYINIILDTSPPSNPSLKINGGSQTTTDSLVNLSIATSDTDTANYQMLIWGDVGNSYNSDIQTTESASSWISYNESLQVRLSNSDGLKNLYLRIRDDVHNPSSQVSASISLDTSLAGVTVTEPDVSKISKRVTKDTATFTFTSDKNFTEYKVKVVSSANGEHDSGSQIPTTGGSQNTSGTGSFTTNTVTTVTIKGEDLEVASPNDGSKIIKVFVKDQNGTWSS